MVITALCNPSLLSPEMPCSSVLGTMKPLVWKNPALPAWLSSGVHGSPSSAEQTLSLLSDTKDKGFVHQMLWKPSTMCHYIILQIIAMHLQNRLMKVLIYSKNPQLFGILPYLCTLPHCPIAT